MAELGLDILADVKKAVMNLKGLEEELEKLSKASKDSSKSLSGLGDESKKSSSKMESVNLSTNKASKGLRNLSGDANRTTSEVARLGKTMSGLSFGGLLGVGLFSGTFAKITQSIMDVEETVNLFNISMGMAAEETEVALRKISDAAGLDHTMLQQATGNYTLLARSMGVAADNAAVLGRSSTRLALDLSSLVNVPIEQVMADLRSGLLGQTETVYKYGLDLTEASLEQERLRLGIDKSVRSMSQAEKMQLRYSVMIRQSSLAHNDLANTIESPSNQIRILANQITGLGRAIGSVFIGTIGKVLPYINGFVMAIRTVVEALATLSGYKPPKVQNMQGGFDSVGDSVDNVNNSVTNLKKNIESITMPFDELNTISEPQSPTPSGGEGGVGAPIDWGLEEYNSQLENVKMKAVEIKETILEWLGFTKQVNEETGLIEWEMPDFSTTQTKFEDLKKLVGEVGAIILGWKVGEEIFSGIEKIKSSSSSMAGAWGAAIGAMILDTVDLYDENESFRTSIDKIREICGLVGDAFKEMGKQFLDALPPELKEAILDLIKKVKELAAEFSWDKFDSIQFIIGNLLLFSPLTRPIGIFILAVKALQLILIALGMDGGRVFDSIIKWLNKTVDEIKKGSNITIATLLLLAAIVAIVAGIIQLALGASFFGWFLIAIGVIAAIIGLIVFLKDPVMWLGNQIVTIIKNTIAVITSMIRSFKATWDFIMQLLGVIFKNVFYTIENVFLSVFNGIINVFETATNIIIDGINFILKAYNKVAEALGMKPIKLIAEADFSGIKAEYKKLEDLPTMNDLLKESGDYVTEPLKKIESLKSFKEYMGSKIDKGDKGAEVDFKKYFGHDYKSTARKDDKNSWFNQIVDNKPKKDLELAMPPKFDVEMSHPNPSIGSGTESSNLTSEIDKLFEQMRRENEAYNNEMGSTVINNTIKLDGKTIYNNQRKIEKSRGIDFNTTAFAR